MSAEEYLRRSFKSIALKLYYYRPDLDVFTPKLRTLLVMDYFFFINRQLNNPSLPREFNDNNADYIILKAFISGYSLDSAYADRIAYDISISKANGSDDELLTSVQKEVKRFSKSTGNLDVIMLYDEFYRMFIVS